MSTFNTLYLRNIKALSSDGTPVTQGYVLTTGSSGIQNWTNQLGLSTVTTSTITTQSTVTNVLTVNSSLVVSSITGATFSAGSMSLSTLGVSSLTASTLSLASSLTVSSITTGSMGFSTLSGSTLSANTLALASSLTTSSITTGSMGFSTLIGSTISSNTLTLTSSLTTSSITSGSITAGSMGFSTLIGSTINMDVLTVSSIFCSSISTTGGVIGGGGTGPTGPAGAGGSGSGGTGYTGPTGIMGSTGPVGQVATLSVTPTTTQSIPVANTNTLILWGTTDSTQSAGNTGLVYSAGFFTNNSGSTLPLLIEYNLLLDVSGKGSSFVGVGTTPTVYGVALNESNILNNTCIIQLPAGSKFGIYYSDLGTPVVQTTSRLTVTVLMAGGVGATGLAGNTTTVAVLSATPSTTQSITASTDTLVAWGTTDSTQSQGITGLSYGSSLFTNTTAGTLPLLVEYAILLSTTGGGGTYIGVNGTTNKYGQLYTTENVFSNSYVILLPAGSSFGIYYVDNNATVVQTSSRITITALMAGIGPTGQQGAGSTGPQGATGSQGPVGQSAILSATPATTQGPLTSGQNTVVLWGTTDSSQSYGSVGLTYAGGSFTNSTTSFLPLTVNYSILLDSTGGGSSYVGVTSGGTTTAYGVVIHTTNVFSNSFSILLPVGASLAIYYMDNGTPTIQTTSRLTISLLVAGQPGSTGHTGPTGPVGQVALLSMTPTTTQALTASTNTIVKWGTMDSGQSIGNTGLSYISSGVSEGLFTNSGSSTIPLLVEYSILLNATGNGSSYVGVTVSGVTTNYGVMINTTNIFANSYVVYVPSGATVGVYYTDNIAATIQTTSRLTITLLVAGQMGATGTTGTTGTTGPTGPSLWTATAGNTGIYYTSGNVGVGTTSPAANLDVSGTINTVNVFTVSDARPASNGLLRILTTTGSNYIQSGLALTSDSKAPLIFGSIFAGSEWMRIATTGNVGIGTVSPSSVLHLHKASDPGMIITNTSVGVLTCGLAGGPGSYAANAELGDVVIRNDSSSKKLHLLAGSNNAVITVTSTSAGIGTTTPVSNLHVYGWGHFGDSSDPSKYGFVQVTRTTTPGDNKFHFSMIRSGTRVAGLGFINGTNTVGFVNGNDMTLIGNGIFITETGNVGIGSSIPGYSLDVNGTIARAGVRLPRFDNGSFSGATSCTIPILFSDTNYNVVEIKVVFTVSDRCAITLTSRDTGNNVLSFGETGITVTQYNNLSAPTHSTANGATSITVGSSLEYGGIDSNFYMRMIRSTGTSSYGNRNHFVVEHIYCIPGVGTTKSASFGHIDKTSIGGLQVGSVSLNCSSGNIYGTYSVVHSY